MSNWLDISPLALYLVGLFVIGLFGLRRKEPDQESLILAGRRLTLPAFVASLVSTWYGGILGVGEFSYRFGVSNWIVFGVPYYIAAGVFAFFLAKRARRSPEMTIPDRLFKSYGLPAAAAGAAILVFITLPVAYVLEIGILFNQFFGSPVWLGILLGTIFSVFYLFAGGFRAAVWADMVQFVAMYVGFIIMLVFAVTKLGGIGYLSANLPATHFSVTGGHAPSYIAFWYIVAMATLAEPAFYQRCFAAKSATVARNGILVSIFFWFTFDFMTTTCGLYARALMPDLTNPVAAYTELGARLLPAGLLGLFFLSLMATVMSTVDSYMFLTATTISHDLFWRFKHFGEDKIHKYTAIGLAFSLVGTIVVATRFTSVVNVWHDFGSIGTSALLLPLITTYWGNYQYSPKGALLSVILSASVTVLLLYIIPLPDHFLVREPIFAGLATSVAIFLATRIPKPAKQV
jgi:SSS family solute:Na+ symporter